VIAAALLAAAAPQSLGVWDGWGAFRRDKRCYAIAAPARGRGGAFASVAVAPSGVRVPFFRLSAPRRPATPLTLSVGERRFALIGRGSAGWSPDPASAVAIVAAMRGGRSLSVEGVADGGRPFADVYLLAGAATAIDAATLCARGR
jgi:hypothetical protein